MGVARRISGLLVYLLPPITLLAKILLVLYSTRVSAELSTIARGLNVDWKGVVAPGSSFP